MKKLLMSARDPGAAANIAVLYEDLREICLFDIDLFASGSAYLMLKQKGFDPHLFEVEIGKDHVDPSMESSSHLLEKASEILKKTGPDIVITGLSSFGAGIDEALIFLSDVPVFAVQDFWGDVNLSLGKPADVYLVMDEYAAEITKKRCGARTEIIGSPKYSRYAFFDIEGMRKRSRKYLGASEGKRVIGWFGQHPDIPGYKDVFGAFLEAVARLKGDYTFFLREHPKFCASSKKNVDFLRSRGVSAIDVTGIGNAEEWISACDLLVTPFSLCGLDHAYMSAFSAKPLGNVLYLMNNESIIDFFIRTSGIKTMPTVYSGMGEWVSDANADLCSLIMRLLSSDSVIAYHDAVSRVEMKYRQDKIINLLLSPL